MYSRITDSGRVRLMDRVERADSMSSEVFGRIGCQTSEYVTFADLELGAGIC